MAKADMKKIVDALWKSPSRQNWTLFVKALPKSGLRYYKVVFQKGKIKRVTDLVEDYAQLYDAKQKPILRIPIYEKDGKKITGATYYMKGLLTINKVDEWIRE
ncbi:MAG: hypothetical protein KGI04_02585 [Candidatus Micrarchaeota archaeon]|nr:hypothetical protein [Candidatus Micrarchaeota archaeon]